MLSRQTGYRVWTRHGQRIFGGPPPGWAGHPEPGRGTEVYCYRLPRSVRSIVDRKFKSSIRWLGIVLRTRSSPSSAQLDGYSS